MTIYLQTMTMFMQPAVSVDSTRRFPIFPADGAGLSETGEPMPFFLLLQQLEGAGFGRYGAAVNGDTGEGAAMNPVRESANGWTSVIARALPQLSGATQEAAQLPGTHHQAQHAGLFANGSIDGTGGVARSETSVMHGPFAAILAKPYGAPAESVRIDAAQSGPDGDTVTASPRKAMHEMYVPTREHTAMNVRIPENSTGVRTIPLAPDGQTITARARTVADATAAGVPNERTVGGGVQTADGNAMQTGRLSAAAKLPIMDQPSVLANHGKTAAPEVEPTGTRNDAVRTLFTAPIVRDLLKDAGANQDGRQERTITPGLTAVDVKRVEPAGGQTGTDYQSPHSSRSTGYGEVLSLNVQQPNEKSFTVQLQQQSQHTVAPKGVGSGPAEGAIESAGARTSTAATVELPRTAMDDIARAMTIRSRDDTSEIRFRLKPDHLGDLVIKVRMEGGRMTAQVDVSHASVKTALEQQLPHLREMLLSRGIDLQRFDIQSGSHSLQSDERGGRHPDRAEGRNKQQPGNDSVESYQPRRMLGYNTIEMIV